MATFKELRLSAPLLEALVHLGYEQPTPIQEQAIPALLDGRDVIGQAQTGTGKTAAFGLPLLQYVDPADEDVQALVLTPTRELCIQVTQALRAYGERRGIQVVAVFGGAPIREQISRLHQPAHVVVGTVGRVKDLMGRHELVLNSARFVVLDEADEMLDLGFLEDVEWILAQCPSGRQTALFSATMPPEIKKLAEARMYDPLMVKVRAPTLTVDTVEQTYVEAGDREKADALARVLKAERPEQAIIFVRTKIGADRLARALDNKGVRVKALHGDLSQGQRDGVMIAFKDGRERLLVATDIAARGLDISGVTHVINYDLPNSPELYVHRIGRTGRVGRSGKAITLMTPKQRKDLDAIERHANTTIEPWSEESGGRAARRQRATVESNGDAAAAPAEAEVAAIAQVEATGDEPPTPTTPSASEPARAEPVAAAPTNGAEPDPGRETRRPRHTKPRRTPDRRRAKLVFGAGRVDGLEPADVIGAIVDGSHLDGEDVEHVRVLERFSFAEVPFERAQEVAEKTAGRRVKGAELLVEVVGS